MQIQGWARQVPANIHIYKALESPFRIEYLLKIAGPNLPYLDSQTHLHDACSLCSFDTSRSFPSLVLSLTSRLLRIHTDVLIKTLQHAATPPRTATHAYYSLIPSPGRVVRFLQRPYVLSPSEIKLSRSC